MTLVSDDPSYWLSINSNRISSYFVVATCVGVTYDWALTFGQEVELVWRQNWSLMTVLYLSVRYLGILRAVINILDSVPTILVTDAGCQIMYDIDNWVNVVVIQMLSAIVITRLHAMYERSRKILIFLVVIFLAQSIFNVVVTVIVMRNISGEELILSGTYACICNFTDDAQAIGLLISITWILGTVWEVLVLCLAVWVAIKHFRNLRPYSTGAIIGDCFTMLIKTHVLYFASFLAVSLFNIIMFWLPTFSEHQDYLSTMTLYGILQILTAVQSVVLGPRLILGLREYHAKLVADSDAATNVTSIAFQERVHISTGNGV